MNTRPDKEREMFSIIVDTLDEREKKGVITFGSKALDADVRDYCMARLIRNINRKADRRYKNIHKHDAVLELVYEAVIAGGDKWQDIDEITAKTIELYDGEETITRKRVINRLTKLWYEDKIERYEFKTEEYDRHGHRKKQICYRRIEE